MELNLQPSDKRFRNARSTADGNPFYLWLEILIVLKISVARYYHSPVGG
jgi:hypothetical protein